MLLHGILFFPLIIYQVTPAMHQLLFIFSDFFRLRYTQLYIFEIMPFL